MQHVSTRSRDITAHVLMATKDPAAKAWRTAVTQIRVETTANVPLFLVTTTAFAQKALLVETVNRTSKNVHRHHA